jgi:hypothetical protein
MSALRTARTLAFGATLLVTGVAAAQPKDARDPAAAESLFQRGVDLMKKGSWDDACKAFDASMKLDPSVGTQINLARCADHYGKIAQAWAAYKKARALNAETPLEKRKASVEAFVDGEIAKLEPRLPYVTVTLTVVGAKGAAAPAPGDVADLALARDEAAVPVEGLGVAVPIDPGKHVFTASAPGYLAVKKELDVAEASKNEVALELVPDPNAQASATEPKPAPAGGAKGAPPVDSGMPATLVAGIVIGSVGGAGLIASAITGGIALADHGTISDLEDQGKCSDATGELVCEPGSQAAAHDAISRGEPLALVSTITLFAGAGLAATGAVLIAVGATSSSDEAPAVAITPVVGPGFTGVVVGGAV